MSENRPLVRVHTHIVPAFHMRLSYRLQLGEKAKKERIEYEEPKTTDVLTVEILYGGSREYKFPETTDGY